MNLNKCNFSIIEPYPKSINLMEKEFYYVMIMKNNEELNVNIKIENKTEESESEEEKDKKKEKLSWWEITLIVISSIIFFTLIFLIICFIKRKKGISSKKLEDKLEKLDEIKELN